MSTKKIKNILNLMRNFFYLHNIEKKSNFFLKLKKKLNSYSVRKITD